MDEVFLQNKKSKKGSGHHFIRRVLKKKKKNKQTKQKQTNKHKSYFWKVILIRTPLLKCQTISFSKLPIKSTTSKFLFQDSYEEGIRATQKIQYTAKPDRIGWFGSVLCKSVRSTV